VRRGRLIPLLLPLAFASCTKTVVVVVTASPTPTGEAVVSPPPGTLFAQARGVRFAYPDTWHLLNSVATGGATVDLVVSPDRDSFIRLQRFAVLINVTPQRLPGLRSQIASLLRQTASRVNGRVTSPLTLEQTASFPGYVGTLRLTTTSGATAQEQLYVFFDQTNEYTLACASTSAMRDQVTAACELARQTFAAPHPLP
jgi:hypothetical protein